MASPQPVAPTRSRGFSVKSDRSQHSGKSASHRRGPSESSEEKARRNLHTKADPLIAMNELQPMAVALQKSNLGSLRDIEHKDQHGNVITDPDLSNPTRPRFERPLDTIRSFEAAIYGAYSTTRGSYARTEDAASQMGDYSRRTSYYGGAQNGNSNGQTPRYERQDLQNNYFGQAPSRPDSVVNGYQNAPQSPETPNPYPYNQQNGRRRTHQRGSPSSPTSPSEGYPNIGNNVSSQSGYPAHNSQRSYDNMASNSGTDSYGQSTDPSSMNSSNDQLQQQALQQRMDDRSQQEYGYSGFSPQVSDNTWTAAAPKQNEKAEKRKSWFKRRFSKD